MLVRLIFITLICQEEDEQERYMLKWYSRSKLGKIGRARKSKVKFFKKAKPGNDNRVDQRESCGE